MDTDTTISELDYVAWVKNWLDALLNPGLYAFFKNGAEIQTGVIFHYDSMCHLFSTPGVITIKVRFGLKPVAGASPQFHLILFGADNQNNVITPYYTTSPFTQHQYLEEEMEDKGNLPLIFMKQWRKNWVKAVLNNAVNNQLFMLTWEPKEQRLRGYNYPLKEIMQAMGAFAGKSNIHIKFGLHRYAPLIPTPGAGLILQTFGLILYASTQITVTPNGGELGIIEGKLGIEEEVVEESGFYDFSAPCPHTC